MSGELVAILAVGAALLGVMLGALVPILLSINSRLQTLGERVSSIEGVVGLFPQRGYRREGRWRGVKN